MKRASCVASLALFLVVGETSCWNVGGMLPVSIFLALTMLEALGCIDLRDAIEDIEDVPFSPIGSLDERRSRIGPYLSPTGLAAPSA